LYSGFNVMRLVSSSLSYFCGCAVVGKVEEATVDATDMGTRAGADAMMGTSIAATATDVASMSTPL